MPRITQEELEAECHELGRLLKAGLPEGVGFVLALFEYGPDGWLSYLSSAKREDCLKALRELITVIETRTN